MSKTATSNFNSTYTKMPDRFKLGVKVADTGKDPMGGFLSFESKDPFKYFEAKKTGRPIFGSIDYLSKKAEDNKNKWATGTTKSPLSILASKSVSEISKEN